MGERVVQVFDREVESPEEVWNEYVSKIKNDSKEEARESIQPLLLEIALFERFYPMAPNPRKESENSEIREVSPTLEEIVVERVPTLTPLTEEAVRTEIEKKYRESKEQICEGSVNEPKHTST